MTPQSTNHCRSLPPAIKRLLQMVFRKYGKTRSHDSNVRRRIYNAPIQSDGACVKDDRDNIQTSVTGSCALHPKNGSQTFWRSDNSGYSFWIINKCRPLKRQSYIVHSPTVLKLFLDRVCRPFSEPAVNPLPRISVSSCVDEPRKSVIIYGSALSAFSYHNSTPFNSSECWRDAGHPATRRSVGCCVHCVACCASVFTNSCVARYRCTSILLTLRLYKCHYKHFKAWSLKACVFKRAGLIVFNIIAL